MREDYLANHLIRRNGVKTIQKRKKNWAHLLEQMISKTMGRKMGKTAPKT